MTKLIYTNPKTKKEIEVTLHDDFDKVELFRIWADYRSPKVLTHKNYYYVYAWTTKQARDYFKKKITWLNIYSIKVLSEEERTEIENKPYEKRGILNEDNYNKLKKILGEIK